MKDANDPMTARFIALYGEAQRQQTILWFEQALREIGGKNA